MLHWLLITALALFAAISFMLSLSTEDALPDETLRISHVFPDPPEPLHIPRRVRTTRRREKPP